jgi:hypothetical protein
MFIKQSPGIEVIPVAVTHDPAAAYCRDGRFLNAVNARVRDVLKSTIGDG